MTVIARLGTLIEDAVQRGDDRASASLRDALELIVSDAGNDRALKGRRSNDAERQRRKRERELRDVTLRHVSQRDGSQGFSPTPPFPNSPRHEDDDTARVAADAVYAESVENLVGMVTERVGSASWPDVDGFLKRRHYATWKGWLKEMLAILTGGKASVDDLAQVCRDDAALDRPIGSPKGLRTFVASAMRDRLHPASTEPRVRGGVAMRTYANGRNALRDLP